MWAAVTVADVTECIEYTQRVVLCWAFVEQHPFAGVVLVVWQTRFHTILKVYEISAQYRTHWWTANARRMPSTTHE